MLCVWRQHFIVGGFHRPPVALSGGLGLHECFEGIYVLFLALTRLIVHRQACRSAYVLSLSVTHVFSTI